MIDTIPVERAFTKIGAKVIVAENDGSRWRRQFTAPSIDIREAGRNEVFILGLPKDTDKTQIQVLDCRPDLRHLLLQVRTEGEIRGQAEVEKYLCGHDERHWFVSAVNATSVMKALDSLKPEIVQNREKRVGVRRAKKHKHHNEAFIRQGEWFFLPTPDFDPEVAKAIVVKNEPISRGFGSKPHMCQELARVGGTTVYSNGSRILSVAEYNALEKSEHRLIGYRQRTTDARVYARGWVRHPDHKTVNLKCWHRVVMNGEIVSGSVKFLD